MGGRRNWPDIRIGPCPGSENTHVLETEMQERQTMEDPRDSSAVSASTETAPHDLSLTFHGVRYQVKNLSRSISFYTHHLGFKLEFQQPPAFASVSVGTLRILLSGPGASGSRPMPAGRHQEPGGWNRVVLRVADLPSCIENLKNAGLHFRNQMEVGPGGKQIQLEDPDGNPIELFESTR